MELNLINEKGKATSKVSASDAAFGREFNEALVHQVITAYLANGRQGTRAQKARGDVNKSNKKPWRQKGTGRARAGRASSPLWRGGGKIFPNLPDENFEHKINRKMYRAGLSAILSQLAREERPELGEEPGMDAWTLGARALAGGPRIQGFLEVLGEWSKIEEAAAGEEDDSGLWSAGLEARIAEGLWASAGFGSRFAAVAEESEKTFVLVGIRWGISSAARLDALRPPGR